MMFSALSLCAALAVVTSTAVAETPALRRRATEGCGVEKTNVTAMSRNMYVGTDASLIAEGKIAEVIQQFFATDYPNQRAQALAEEICEAKPDLIGLQEATIVTFLAGGGTVTVLEIDFVQILLGLVFVECGIVYSNEVSSENFEIAVPAVSDLLPPFLTDVEFATSLDQDVILVKADESLVVEDAADGKFVSNNVVPVPGVGPFEFTRGWCYVDLSVDGRPLRFINTHLEPASPFIPTGDEINLDQAKEIANDVIGITPDDRGLVVVGDFNFVPGTDAYQELLEAGLSDAWVDNRLKNDDGFTCCQDDATGFLSNKKTEVSARIDYVLSRGSVDGEVPIEAGQGRKPYLVGDKRFQNVVPKWASNHAGVVANFELVCNNEDTESDGGEGEGI